MKPWISVITLGVSDLNRSLRFYRDGMGLPTQSRAEEGIVFFHTHGTMLALYPWTELARDISPSQPDARGSFSGITLSHNVGSPREVDQVLEQARSAGGALLKSGQQVFWGGYSGYFADPDGHHWEVVYNPKMSLSPEGFLSFPNPGRE